MLGVRLICVGKLGEKFWAQADLAGRGRHRDVR